MCTSLVPRPIRKIGFVNGPGNEVNVCTLGLKACDILQAVLQTQISC